MSDITLNSGSVDSWETNGFEGLTKWKPASIWGTFEGQGHTISGLYLSTASQNAGMFGNVKCNAIKNFSLKNSYLESTFTLDANIGSIAGTFGGNMVNVYSDAKVVTTKGFKAGGLVGYGAHQKSDMSGCCFAGDLVVNNQSAYQPYAGGFIGYQYYGYIEIYLNIVYMIS